MSDDEWVDIEDDVGNVVGKLDLTTMRALAPHPELNEALAANRSIFYRRRGMRYPLSLDRERNDKRRR